MYHLVGIGSRLLPFFDSQGLSRAVAKDVMYRLNVGMDPNFSVKIVFVPALSSVILAVAAFNRTRSLQISSRLSWVGVTPAGPSSEGVETSRKMMFRGCQVSTKSRGVVPVVRCTCMLYQYISGSTNSSQFVLCSAT